MPLLSELIIDAIGIVFILLVMRWSHGLQEAITHEKQMWWRASMPAYEGDTRITLIDLDRDTSEDVRVLWRREHRGR